MLASFLSPTCLSDSVKFFRFSPLCPNWFSALWDVLFNMACKILVFSPNCYLTRFLCSSLNSWTWMSVFEVYLCSWFLGGKRHSSHLLRRLQQCFPFYWDTLYCSPSGVLWWNMIAKIWQVFSPNQVRQDLESMLEHIPSISNDLGLLKQLPTNFWVSPLQGLILDWLPSAWWKVQLCHRL